MVFGDLPGQKRFGRTRLSITTREEAPAPPEEKSPCGRRFRSASQASEYESIGIWGGARGSGNEKKGPCLLSIDWAASARYGPFMGPTYH